MTLPLLPTVDLNRLRIKSRTQYLASMRTGPTTYRPATDLPLRYKGGKAKAAARIIAHFPNPLPPNIVSPFIGGGAIEITLARDLGHRVEAFDIFDLLVNAWHHLLNTPRELAVLLATLENSPEAFDTYERRIRAHFEGRTYIANFATPGLTVACADFTHSIPAADPEAFIYADPPYYNAEGHMNSGIYPNGRHPIHHDGFDHTHLRDLLTGHPGGFALSYNDCEPIRRLYCDFEQIELAWQYTLNATDHRTGHELLILAPPQ